MNFELNILNNELDTLLGEFRDTLKKMTVADQADRAQKMRECRHIIQQIRTAKEAYVLELRGLENRDPYETQLRQRLSTFKQLSAELEYKKTEIDRTQLTAGPAEPEELDPNVLPPAQLQAHGDQVQNQTQESLNRAKQMVVGAEQIGLETVKKMDQQIEQMGKVGEGLDDVEYNISRAKKTVQGIAKSAANDRCIQVLCVAIFLSIVVIIILAVT